MCSEVHYTLNVLMRLSVMKCVRHLPCHKMCCAVCVRAGVNSAPELELIANSNSGIGIEIAIIGILIELELKLT